MPFNYLSYITKWLGSIKLELKTTSLFSAATATLDIPPSQNLYTRLSNSPEGTSKRKSTKMANLFSCYQISNYTSCMQAFKEGNGTAAWIHVYAPGTENGPFGSF